MRTFLNLIGKGLLLIILISLVKTAFSLKTDSFINFDENDYNIPIIFAVILLFVAGLLMYVILHNIIKLNKKRIILSSIFFLVTIIYFIYEFRIQSEMMNNGDEIGLKSTDTRTFNYNEKLISFESPYKLYEQSLSDGALINKSYRSEDINIFYIEMDGEAMEARKRGDKKQEIKEKYTDLSLPKIFFEQGFKQQGINIDPSQIEITKINENDIRLSIELQDGTQGIMYFLNKDYFFSTFQIIHRHNSDVIDMSLKILKSIIIK